MGQPLVVFTSGDLGGRLPPKECVSVDSKDASNLLADVLGLPGLETVRWSRGWQPERRKKGVSEWWRSGLNESAFEMAHRVAADRVEDRLGIRPVLGGNQPDEIAPVYFEEIQRAVDEVKQRMRAARRDERSHGIHPGVTDQTTVRERRDEP
jgi:hypothetical protein